MNEKDTITEDNVIRWLIYFFLLIGIPIIIVFSFPTMKSQYGLAKAQEIALTGGFLWLILPVIGIYYSHDENDLYGFDERFDFCEYCGRELELAKNCFGTEVCEWCGAKPK